MKFLLSFCLITIVVASPLNRIVLTNSVESGPIEHLGDPPLAHAADTESEEDNVLPEDLPTEFDRESLYGDYPGDSSVSDEHSTEMELEPPLPTSDSNSQSEEEYQEYPVYPEADRGFVPSVAPFRIVNAPPNWDFEGLFHGDSLGEPLPLRSGEEKQSGRAAIPAVAPFHIVPWKGEGRVGVPVAVMP